jgi:hypothetical protein
MQQKIAMHMVSPRILIAQMDACVIALVVGLGTAAQCHHLAVHIQTVLVMEPRMTWTRPMVAFATVMDAALWMRGLQKIVRCHLPAMKTPIAVVTATPKTWTRQMAASATVTTSILVLIVRCHHHAMQLSTAVDMV